MKKGDDVANDDDDDDLSANPLENIGSVFLLYVYDCHRPLAPI
jgi:hypothetical protein